MKIIQINAVYKVGSTGRNVYELHSAMKEKGIHSYIAATHINAKEKDCYQIGNKADWKIHALMSRFTGLQGYFSYFATRRLICYLQEIKPDVVHLNNCHANYLNLGLLFRYLAKENIATVITLHDCWFYTGKCTHYTIEKCEKWKTGCQDCPKLHADNCSWFFDRTSKMWKDKQKWLGQIHSLGIVGVSDWITNEAQKSMLSSARIIRRIYNWIDLESFKKQKTDFRKRYRLEGKFIVLGVASGWSENKGLQSFIELSHVLKDDEIIILVGKMPTNIALPQNIMNIDATNSIQELAEYYSEADVFVQLSLQESFGKVVVEAMACGTPVVTVDSTANAELVPNKCGIVLPDMDIDAIYSAVQAIRSTQKSSYEIMCRRFTEDNFSLESCTEQYINVYKELLNKEEE